MSCWWDFYRRYGWNWKIQKSQGKRMVPKIWYAVFAPGYLANINKSSSFSSSGIYSENGHTVSRSVVPARPWVVPQLVSRAEVQIPALQWQPHRCLSFRMPLSAKRAVHRAVRESIGEVALLLVWKWRVCWDGCGLETQNQKVARTCMCCR